MLKYFVGRSFSLIPNFFYSPPPSHLDCRRIQAPLINSFINEFAEEIGYEETIDIVRKMVKKDAILSGKILSEEYCCDKDDDISPIFALEKIITEIWCSNDDDSDSEPVMEIDILLLDSENFHFNVTKCGYAEMYEDLEIDPEIGKVLSCERDFPWCIGFDSNLTLERKKTIMEGDDICDFKYYFNNNNNKES